MLLLLPLARGPKSGMLMPGSSRAMSVRLVTPAACNSWPETAEIL